MDLDVCKESWGVLGGCGGLVEVVELVFFLFAD